jgi:peptidoglycan hydrolase-like protein with peptidoglycan-binding domain
MNSFAPVPQSPQDQSPVLQQGSQGEAVQQVQQVLQRMGFAIGKPDGQFGPKTATAVRLFQAQAGLTVTGAVDVLTLAALGFQVDEAVSASPTTKFTGILARNL